MTEPNEPTTEPVENLATSPESGPENESPTPGQDEAPEPDKDGRRDARTREKLRETETQVEALRAALIPHVRSSVEKLVSDRLSDGSALWLLPDLDPLGLLDESFSIDEPKVFAAVDRLLTHAPTLGRRFIGSGDGGARFEGSEPTGNRWSELMNHGRGGRP